MEAKQLINATCPECRGPLTETVHSNGEGEVREYNCLVGHCYAARALLQAHSEAQEKALWSAVVALEEACNLVDAVAAEFPPEVAKKLKRQAKTKREQAKALHQLLEHLEPFQTG